VHLRRPPARAGLLAAAAALIAMLVAVPNAGAATFAGGPFKIDFKASKLKVAMVGQDTTTDTKTGGTFNFTEGSAGTVTMNNQPSGTLTIGGSTTQITLTHANKKKIVLKSLVEKLAAGKGQLAAKVNGKGGSIAFFNEATTNRLKAASDFTRLTLETSTLTLTAQGAAALNKAFGLKKPKKGQKDRRLKNKQKMGTASFDAHRLLEFSGGQTTTAFDQGFYDQLKNECDITLAATGTAQPISPGAAAPRGGAILNVISGQMHAPTLSGTVQHDQGGTSLDRPEGSSKGKAYHTEVISYEYSRGPAQSAFLVRAYSTAVINTVAIGALEGGMVTADLSDTGGTVTISGGVLRLSEAAAGLLKQQTGCEIAANSPLAISSTTANVK
jgi:hypothetical protein